MYIPHADYPKDQGAFNTIKALPELFNDIDFRDFALTMRASRRSDDFFNAEMFLYASQYQSNYGAKLVMLLSAVERTNGTWIPLERDLMSREFKKELRACKNGKGAELLLNARIETYLNNFGSTRSVVRFFQDNLTNQQKKRLVNGINYGHTYKKQPAKDGSLTLFKSVRIPSKKFSTKEEELNYELARRLRHVVYTIRSAFVHCASYIPFPDKKYLKDKTVFSYERFEGGEPKDEWMITLSFESLHELTRAAFIEYWRKEYHKMKIEAK